MVNYILVLGAGGFVGRHLVPALVKQGERVLAVSRHPVEFDTTAVETIVGELNAPEQFSPLIAGSRAVVHLASSSTPGSSAGNALAELDHNLRPTLALLQALQDKPQTNLLYLSSGGSLYGGDSTEVSAEASTVAPRSYHGAGKVASEHFISAWCTQYDGAATILRPSNIYGPGQRERAGFGIVPASFGKLIRGETLTVWGGDAAVRDYLYIDDFVELCAAILSRPMPLGAHVLNAASGVGVSLNELFLAIETVSGQKLNRFYDVRRAVDASRVVMDPTLAKRLYHWTPSTPLIEGLRKTWDWFNTTQR